MTKNRRKPYSVNGIHWPEDANFAEIAKVSGDTGAKHLIGEHADLVCEVEMTGEAAITDIDTPEALAAWQAKWVIGLAMWVTM